MMIPFIIDGSQCIAASSPASLFLSSACAAAEAGRRHSAVSSPSCYLPVSVDDVGGLEDGGGTQLASGPRLLRCSSRAGGCWQGVRGSPRHPRESSGSWRQRRGRLVKKKKKKKKSPLRGDPPCAPSFHPDPGHSLTWAIRVGLARLPRAPSIVASPPRPFDKCILL
ncbi:hypothetical protein HJG60_010465 [Phyllostomus discolor]|uniref:Uncharacterized protein n=1 Tax=Phyllostomus discolor TaxID=89673 RepID=A0A834ARB4_9CHIR|nr:hypothetical protein HJG60_010465 [Phyllostomus discolor]